MDENSKRSLYDITKQLAQLNDHAAKRYSEVKDDENYVVDFYNEVKPFADEVLEIANEWKKETLAWLKQNKIQYLYPMQIEDTYENLLFISVKAFQTDTRARRFNERIKSIDYVLHKILNQLN